MELPSSRPRFDVCVSFSGEERELARALAKRLKTKHNLTVFFDEDHPSETLGRNLYEYFYTIFSKEALFCVMIVSISYKNKMWTRHERRAAQTRMLREEKEYVLPLRVGDVDLPVEFEDIGYLDLNFKNVTKIANIISEKVINHLVEMGELVSVDEVVEQVNKDRLNSVIMNEIFAASRKDRSSNRILARALVGLIALTEDKEDRLFRQYINWILTSLKPLEDQFDEEDAFQIGLLPDTKIKRWLDGSGNYVLLFSQDFVARKKQELREWDRANGFLEED